MQAARRQVLFGMGTAAAALAVPGVMQSAVRGGASTANPLGAPGLSAASASDVRRVVLHNLHTGDTFNDVYFERGAYVPDALAEAQRVLRDWRSGDEHFMDPGLFDILHNISGKLETDRSFQIISGYRSPKSNAAMHARSAGVASNSQHTYGKALDIRVQGVELSNLHKAALSLKAGGVGYYPVSNFVHVDVARVRTWTGA